MGQGHRFGVNGDEKRAYGSGNFGGYVIESVDSPTQLTLASPYEGKSDTGRTYRIDGRYVWYGHGDGWHKRDYAEFRPEHEGLPTWAFSATWKNAHGYRGGLDWDKSYKGQTAPRWGGFVLAAQIMQEKAEARSLWNHQALFDYMDRHMEVTKGKGRERQSEPFVEKMWDTYRARFGSVWTEEKWKKAREEAK